MKGKASGPGHEFQHLVHTNDFTQIYVLLQKE